ncbi:MAG: hypothetical protein J0H79_16285 [Alphaproteobacteria bacterium]|nr:hypothetical protein [Alphaproteobacteria bacterium]
MTERDKFLTRLAEDRGAGLIDMKFFFRPSRPMTPEEIFGAINEVDEAVENGHRHKGWTGNVPA